MTAFALDWINLAIRWFHLIVGIAWIGASFHFVWLDFSLRARENMNKGVFGTSWLVHGGGFYHVEKYLVAPAELPPELHWFKWEAYLTFVSGFLLMCLQYYWNASQFLVDPSVLPLAGWRGILIIFGMLGVAWAVTWYRWFRDEPSEHPAVNAAEREWIESDRATAAGHPRGWDYWRRLLSHRNTLPLCLMYLPNSFGFYFCITWLPTFLREKHGFDATTLGFFAGLPLLLSVGGDLLGGVATDTLTRRHGPRIGRAGAGAGAYGVAAVAMGLAATVTQPVLAAWLVAVAVGASMFILAAAWSTCLDIGGNHAGVVSAAMNTAGQIGSIGSPLIVTYLLKLTGDWNAPLLVIGGLYAMGAICWCLIDPRRRIFD